MGLFLPFLFFKIGVRIEHIIILPLILIMYFYSSTTNKFFWCLMGILLFVMAFDVCGVYPNHFFRDVHVQDLFQHELDLFGVSYEGNILTPHQYLQHYQYPILDFFSGFFYLMWMPAPLAFCTYLFFKNRPLSVRYTYCFLTTCTLGMIVYYIYPAAPPWYVDEYGFTEMYNIPGSAAGLVRFDDLFGTNIFSGIYTQNNNVFAAIPSLHSAYPIISLYYAVKSKNKMIILFMSFQMIWTWFGAVYTSHHYVIDVILGILCAILAIIIFEHVLPRTPMRKHLESFQTYITS